MAFLNVIVGAIFRADSVIRRGASRLRHAGRRSWGGASPLLLAWICCLIGPFAPLGAAPAANTREYQVKAVFLFNFVQFVNWPAEAFPAEDAPIRIGVLGDDPFGPALEETVRDETIGQRRLVVERSRRVDDLQGCHLLFISKSESRSLDALLDRCRSRPVLTVSDIDGFARQGGVIAFYPEGKKVRFEINAGVARAAGLKMSSELLNLGRIVGAPASGEGAGR